MGEMHKYVKHHDDDVLVDRAGVRPCLAFGLSFYFEFHNSLPSLAESWLIARYMYLANCEF